MIGGDGDDTYVFGNGWGTDTITDAVGTAVLDFDGVTGELTLDSSGAPAESGTVTSGAGDKVDYGGGATFSTGIGVLDTQAAEDALVQGLDALADLGDHLDEFDRMGEELFVLSGRSIGDYLDIGTILRDKLARPVADFLASDNDPTLDELMGIIDSSNGSFGNLAFTVDAVGARAADGDLTLDISLNATRTLSGIGLNLGEDIGSLLTVDGLTGELTTAFDWDLSVDVDGTTFHADFATDMTVTAEINEDVEFDAEAGFLELRFGEVDGDTSNITLDADMTVDTSTLGSGVAEADLRDPDFSGFVSSVADDADVSIDLYGEAPDITGVTDTTAAEIHFGDDLFWTIKGTVLGAANGETETTVTIDADPALADGAVEGRLIRNLNDGAGVGTLDGNDIHVTLRNNSSFEVDLTVDATDLTASGFAMTTVAGADVEVTLRDGTNISVDFDIAPEELAVWNLGDIGTVEGNDIEITLNDGTFFRVDLNRASDEADFAETETVQDLLDRILAAAPGTLVDDGDFRVTTRSNRLRLVDRTTFGGGGGVGFHIADRAGSAAATSLGIAGTGTGPPGSLTITGDTLPEATLLDLMNRIRRAADNAGEAFQVTYDRDRGVLRLVDNTNWQGVLSAANTSGSDAATRLGIAVPATVEGTAHVIESPLVPLSDLFDRIEAAAPGGLVVDRAEMRLVDFTSGDELFEVTAVEQEGHCQFSQFGGLADSVFHVRTDLVFECLGQLRWRNGDRQFRRSGHGHPRPGRGRQAVRAGSSHGVRHGHHILGS